MFKELRKRVGKEVTVGNIFNHQQVWKCIKGSHTNATTVKPTYLQRVNLDHHPDRSCSYPYATMLINIWGKQNIRDQLENYNAELKRELAQYWAKEKKQKAGWCQPITYSQFLLWLCSLFWLVPKKHDSLFCFV